MFGVDRFVKLLKLLAMRQFVLLYFSLRLFDDIYLISVNERSRHCSHVNQSEFISDRPTGRAERECNREKQTNKQCVDEEVLPVKCVLLTAAQSVCLSVSERETHKHTRSLSVCLSCYQDDE